jgi:hypothetical protein
VGDVQPSLSGDLFPTSTLGRLHRVLLLGIPFLPLPNPQPPASRAADLIDRLCVRTRAWGPTPTEEDEVIEGRGEWGGRLARCMGGEGTSARQHWGETRRSYLGHAALTVECLLTGIS